MRTLLTLALLFGQVGVQSVIMTGPPGGPVYNACLISGWPMNEGSGTTLHDVSANANTVTIGGPTQMSWGTNAGFPGSSVTITGTNPAMAATSTTLTNFTGTTAFSLAAWINITSTGSNQIIVSDITNAGPYLGWEMLATSNNLYFLLSHSVSGSNFIEVHGATNIQNTGKHYVVATYDGSQTAAGVKLYVDGSLESMTTLSNTLSLSTASGIVPELGERPADQNGMLGVLAAVAIYNCVLNSTDIATYNARGPQVN